MPEGSRIELFANVSDPGLADGTPVDASVTLREENERTVAEISFVDGGAIADGEYQLLLRGDRVIANGRTLGDDRIDDSFQNYGDHNENGVVDLLDFAAFRSTFGKSAEYAGFLDHLDANGNETIDLLDIAAFRARFGR